MEDFLQREGFGLFFLVFFAKGFRELRRVDAGAFGINPPKRRMVLDSLVEERLSDGRIIHFAVAVAAVANEVNNNVAAKSSAIFRSEPANAHYGGGIFRVDVEYRHGLALGQVRSETRRMVLRRQGRETDEAVHADVNRAADGVRTHVSKVERLRPHALACEGRVAMA